MLNYILAKCCWEGGCRKSGQVNLRYLEIKFDLSLKKDKNRFILNLQVASEI